MKKLALITLCMTLTSCAAMYSPKKTEFYKDNKLVKTYIGRGIFDKNDSFDTYRIWALDDWRYYEFTCASCEVVETIIEQKK
jgi:hypothetical protein